MGIDLDFWKCKPGVSLDSAAVYQRACCDREALDGLEALPIDDILRAIAAAFPD